MRILVTNDDGINAPGLDVLQKIAESLSDDIWTVAPESDQSGTSHSLTLHEPLRCRTIDERTFAVKGTPTDCVIMAVRHLMADALPDLVLSGVNRGHNVADDVTYSGTIAAAMEGVVLGVPSIALSLAIGPKRPVDIHWETPMVHGADVVRELLRVGWPKDVIMNVNFPAVAPEEVAGHAVVSQGSRDQSALNIIDRLDARGVPYYWFGFERQTFEPAADTDLAALAQNRIAITPLHLNLTHFEFLQTLKGTLGTAPGSSGDVG